MLSEWRKCRKLPVVVEYREVKKERCDAFGIWRESIHTREGVLWAYPDEDYIIRDIEGEIYPIKKEIFAKTYEVLDVE